MSSSGIKIKGEEDVPSPKVLAWTRKGISNPCSGRYGSGEDNEVEILVDIDKTTVFSKVLKFVSGTIAPKVRPWPLDAAAVYFQTMPLSIQTSDGKSNVHMVSSDIKAVFSDGTIKVGFIELTLILDEKKETWTADFDLHIRGLEKLPYKGIEKKSLFFREVNMAMDFTDKSQWPNVELGNLVDVPETRNGRKIDLFSAFTDAGIELVTDPDYDGKINDPIPGSPWTKSDLYEAMQDFFDKQKNSSKDIWCLIGTTPPDKRYFGFSLNKKGRRGFGLFTGHSSFKNLEDKDEEKKALAQRRFLHYMMNECGKCLGLRDAFKNGTPNSLSWMNYSWKYDEKFGAGTFHRHFKFQFSEKELLVLRHIPSMAFQEAAGTCLVSSIVRTGYEAKTEAPDYRLTDDDDDVDRIFYSSSRTGKAERPLRKISLDLKPQKQYSMSQLLSFEARITNKGKLPALIEGDLSVESGNLRLYISKSGRYKTVDPFVRPIYSAYGRPKVLYTAGDKKGLDRYSELVTVGAGSDGYVVDGPGEYEIRAVYNGGRYTTSSDTYKIIVVDDPEEDTEMREELLAAATLQSSNFKRFKKASDVWNEQISKKIQVKKSYAPTTVALLQGLAYANDRYESSTKYSFEKSKTREYGKPAVKREQLLKDTDDLLEHYQKEGSKEDNLAYSNLVLARGKLHVALNKTDVGKKEFDRMSNDVLSRGAKDVVAKRLAKKWKKIASSREQEDKNSAENLQKKFVDIANWVSSPRDDGEPDISGIGLGKPFSRFYDDHVDKGLLIIDKLFKKHEETQDLNATLEFADKLQKGREVNSAALHWATKAFVVHSRDAKKTGMRFPEPEINSEEEHPGIRGAVRGEDRMDYWRCDADMTYHHEHWHMVYILWGKVTDRDSWNRVAANFRRQGEIFGYMHSQMLARYDAERESWGLQPVQRWKYSDKSPPFKAGHEFAADPRVNSYVPRPAATWPLDDQTKFRKWESEYKNAVGKGTFIGIDGKEQELTPNWAGILIEPAVEIFPKYGAIHNEGHMVFATTGIEGDEYSYMGDPMTATRDFIFYRWHKRIDYLYQMSNEKSSIDIKQDPPPVVITADDIIVSNDPNPPTDFVNFNGAWFTKHADEVTTLQTMLGPPMKRYELDNKLDHERFYYHIRIMRGAGAERNVAIPLTIRIFICPKKRQSDRKRWIEMDKFVCEIGADKQHIVFTRKDIHSSVIKRNPKDMDDSIENKYTKEVPGFCECGWPYSMLLPRGNKDGEEYVLFVMATDNKKDQIGIRTRCGSMSYCGADDPTYPDIRTMGYPFAHPIKYKEGDDEVPIPQAFDDINNAAYKTFIIKNDVAEDPPVEGVNIWWPQYQVNHVRPEDTEPYVSPIFQYTPSTLTGRFEVLIDGQASVSPRGNQMMIRFMGRGRNNGDYQIGDVMIYPRGDNAAALPITFEGQKIFSVPEYGLISDPFSSSFDLAQCDHMVSFTTGSPGAYLDAPQGSTQTSTYHYVEGETHRYAFIQCIGGILSSLSK